MSNRDFILKYSVAMVFCMVLANVAISFADSPGAESPGAGSHEATGIVEHGLGYRLHFGTGPVWEKSVYRLMAATPEVDALLRFYSVDSYAIAQAMTGDPTRLNKAQKVRIHYRHNPNTGYNVVDAVTGPAQPEPDAHALAVEYAFLDAIDGYEDLDHLIQHLPTCALAAWAMKREGLLTKALSAVLATTGEGEARVKEAREAFLAVAQTMTHSQKAYYLSSLQQGGAFDVALQAAFKL